MKRAIALVVFLFLTFKVSGYLFNKNGSVSLFEEAVQTIKREGFISFGAQTINFFRSRIGLVSESSIFVDSRINVDYNGITILSDTIQSPDNKNMYYLPMFIYLDEYDNLGYRNRGDYYDIYGCAIISSFSPFSIPDIDSIKKTGKMPIPTLDSYMLAINNSGSFKVGKLIEFIGTNYKVSQTWNPKKITGINLDGINSTLGWSSYTGK